MRTTLVAILACCSLIAPAQAQSMEWGDVSLPVQSSDWHQLNEAKRIAYLTGALQASAFLNGDTPAEIGCINNLIDPLLADTARASFDDTLVFAVADMALNSCANAIGADGSLISSRTLSDIVGGPDGGELWVGITVGLADYVHFHTFANVGSDLADCLQDETLNLLGLDRANPRSWTTTPDAPFVVDVLSASYNACK